MRFAPDKNRARAGMFFAASSASGGPTGGKPPAIFQKAARGDPGKFAELSAPPPKGLTVNRSSLGPLVEGSVRHKVLLCMLYFSAWSAATHT